MSTSHSVMKDHILRVWNWNEKKKHECLILSLLEECSSTIDFNRTNPIVSDDDFAVHLDFFSYLFPFISPDTTSIWCRSHAFCFQQLFRCTSGVKHSQMHGSLLQCSVGRSSWMSPGWLTAPLTNGETSHTMCKFSIYSVQWRLARAFIVRKWK